MAREIGGRSGRGKGGERSEVEEEGGKRREREKKGEEEKKEEGRND